jgi:hypothetical protein
MKNKNWTENIPFMKAFVIIDTKISVMKREISFLIEYLSIAAGLLCVVQKTKLQFLEILHEIDIKFSSRCFQLI